MQPSWRGTDPYEIEKPLRRVIRERLPGFGVVVNDLDLTVRHYGNGNPVGTFRDLEAKYGTADLTRGQAISFRQRHRLLRLGDPEAVEYKGFYLVQYDDPEWGPDTVVTLTRKFEDEATRVWTLDEFLTWLNMNEPC